MIEETATVVKATPDFIWVEVATRTACASCGSKSDCATSSISKLFGTRRQQLRFANSTASKVGDKVIIGVADKVMVSASVTAYLLPVILMLGAAIIGDRQHMSDIQQAGVALLSLLLGLFSAAVLTSNQRMQRFFQPKLLRKADSVSVYPIEFKRFQGDTP